MLLSSYTHKKDETNEISEILINSMTAVAPFINMV